MPGEHTLRGHRAKAHAQFARRSALARPPGRPPRLPATERVTGTISVIPRILRTHAASAADGRPTLLETGEVATLPAVTVIRAPWVKLKAVLRTCRQRVERKAQGRHGEKRGTHGLLPGVDDHAAQIPAHIPRSRLHSSIFRRSGNRFAAENATTKRQTGANSDSIGTEFAPAGRSSLCRDGSAGSPFALGSISRAATQADPASDNVLDVSARSAVCSRHFRRRVAAGFNVEVARKERCNDREILSSYE
jgi:hypothetical protein